MWNLLWEFSQVNLPLAHADHFSDNKLLFWQQPEYLRNDRAKEGMIIIIMIIIIIVTVIWDAGAQESCSCLWFIKTCSPAALVLSHIPQHVKLFVSGCVGAVEGGEGDMFVSQQLHWLGIEERAVWHTANRSTTCQSTHCYHPAL